VISLWRDKLQRYIELKSMPPASAEEMLDLFRQREWLERELIEKNPRLTLAALTIVNSIHSPSGEDPGSPCVGETSTSPSLECEQLPVRDGCR